MATCLDWSKKQERCTKCDDCHDQKKEDCLRCSIACVVYGAGYCPTVDHIIDMELREAVDHIIDMELREAPGKKTKEKRWFKGID
jgi:hypothetical protein